MWKRMMLYEILRRVHQPQLQIHESRMWLEAYIEAYRSCHIAIVDHMEYTHAYTTCTVSFTRAVGAMQIEFAVFMISA